MSGCWEEMVASSQRVIEHARDVFAESCRGEGGYKQ